MNETSNETRACPRPQVSGDGWRVQRHGHGSRISAGLSVCEARAALSLEDRETLVVGDMLATISMVPAESRPHLPPRFTNDDHERALASLQKIELVKARRLAVRVLVHGPVHGDPALVLADSLASSAPMNAAYRSPPRP